MEETKKFRKEIGNNGWQEVWELLPHKFPLILIDKILDFEKGKYIKVQKNVSFNEPFFSGHFPDNPLMPGVLIVESVAQSCGLFIVKSFPELSDGNALLVGINKTKFMREVRPGDILEIESRLSKRLGDIFVFKGKVFVENEIATETEIIISVK